MFDHNETLKTHWEVVSHWMEIAEGIIKNCHTMHSKCEFLSIDFLDICDLLNVHSQKNDVLYFSSSKSKILSEAILFIDKGQGAKDTASITKEFFQQFFGECNMVSNSTFKWQRNSSLENLGMVVTVLTAQDVAMSFCIPLSSIISLDQKNPIEIVKEGYAYLMDDGEIMICEFIGSDKTVWSWSLGDEYLETRKSHFIQGYSMGYAGCTYSEFETKEEDVLKMSA